MASMRIDMGDAKGSSQKLSVALAHLLANHSGHGAHDPGDAYAAFVFAVRRRDADTVLGAMTQEYGAGLRRYRERPRFAIVFDLWCAHFPRHIETIACFIDGDSAVLETSHEVNGRILPGRITMIHEHGEWRVASERCAGERTRLPVTGFLASVPIDTERTTAHRAT